MEHAAPSRSRTLQSTLLASEWRGGCVYVTVGGCEVGLANRQRSLWERWHAPWAAAQFTEELAVRVLQAEIKLVVWVSANTE